jgi:hypothetical protein
VEKWTTNEDSSGTFSEKITERAEAEKAEEATTRQKKAERKAERKHFMEKITELSPQVLLRKIVFIQKLF